MTLLEEGQAKSGWGKRDWNRALYEVRNIYRGDFVSEFYCRFVEESEIRTDDERVQRIKLGGAQESYASEKKNPPEGSCAEIWQWREREKLCSQERTWVWEVFLRLRGWCPVAKDVDGVGGKGRSHKRCRKRCWRSGTKEDEAESGVCGEELSKKKPKK